MNESPEISVLITSFNRAALLSRCLASVLAQQGPTFEVIVIDDASTDETPQVVARLADARLHYHRMEQNCGAPAKPRNAGLALARAPLLFVFDSDDTMLPGCLAAFVAAFAVDARLGLAWSWKNVLDNEGVIVELEKRDRLLTEPHFPLALSYAPGANGLAIHRQVIDAIGGFDEALPRMDDYDFTLRFLAAGRWTLSVLPTVTMNVHSDSMDHVSASGKRTLTAREHVLRKHQELFARFPEVYARHLFNLALLRLQIGRDRAGFVAGVLASLRIAPRHPRRALALWRILPGALPSATSPRSGAVRRNDLKRNLTD